MNDIKSKPLIIGHNCELLENTLKYILYAIDIKVDGIKLDVYKCKTDELIVFREKTFEKLAFMDQYYFKNIKNKHINKLTLNHINKIDLIDTMGRKYKIPTVYDILYNPKVYNSNILINIEIKDKESHEILMNLIYDLIEEELYTPDRFLISSLDINIIDYLHEFKNELVDENRDFINLKIGHIEDKEIILDNYCFDCDKFSEKYELNITHLIIDISLINKIPEKIKNHNIRIFVYNNINININNYDGIIIK